ncbi:MAG: hypothetical protein FWG45_07975 [Oscillospiraceae bacterium]|nr:hypothetical protein [Oscillospiraceae bacterium]
MIQTMRDLCSHKDNIVMTYHVSERIRKRCIIGNDIISAIIDLSENPFAAILHKDFPISPS